MKKPKKRRSPPKWLTRLEKNVARKHGISKAERVRREICQRGGRSAIKKLQMWHERREVMKTVEALRQKKSQQKVIDSLLSKSIEANEHLVPIDDTYGLED